MVDRKSHRHAWGNIIGGGNFLEEGSDPNGKAIKQIVGYIEEQSDKFGFDKAVADEDEAQLVARRGAAMTLCSGSIGIIDGVVPPARAFQEAGGMVALGSDQAPGNNNHNMINEMKLTALFNKIRYQDPEVMPAWRVLRMATIPAPERIAPGSGRRGRRHPATRPMR